MNRQRVERQFDAITFDFDYCGRSEFWKIRRAILDNLEEYLAAGCGERILNILGSDDVFENIELFMKYGVEIDINQLVKDCGSRFVRSNIKEFLERDADPIALVDAISAPELCAIDESVDTAELIASFKKIVSFLVTV